MPAEGHQFSCRIPPEKPENQTKCLFLNEADNTKLISILCVILRANTINKRNVSGEVQ